MILTTNDCVQYLNDNTKVIKTDIQKVISFTTVN